MSEGVLGVLPLSCRLCLVIFGASFGTRGGKGGFHLHFNVGKWPLFFIYNGNVFIEPMSGLFLHQIKII